MKRYFLVLAVLFITAVTPTLAQSKIYAANGKLPSRAQLDLMLEDTMARLDRAMKTNRFDALLAWSSTPTRDRYKTGAEFGKPFGPYVKARADLSVLVTAPRTYPNVTLQKAKMKGVKPTANRLAGGELLNVQAKYDLKSTIVANVQYLSEKGLWKLVNISLRVTPRK